MLLDQVPPLKHRFTVTFLALGIIPNPVDMYFQKVSGLSQNISVETLNEGGENLHQHRFPTRVEYKNLILERGMPLISPLSIEFNIAMSTFKFAPSNIIIILHNNDGVPLASWLFFKAWPVAWSVSDLDAEANGVMIDHLELAYESFQVLRL